VQSEFLPSFAATQRPLTNLTSTVQAYHLSCAALLFFSSINHKLHTIMQNNKIITAALAKLNADTKLCDIPSHEFETGGKITKALREAGYDESGMIVINHLGMWNNTVEQLKTFLTNER
jgi:hypothetical protein